MALDLRAAKGPLHFSLMATGLPTSRLEGLHIMKNLIRRLRYYLRRPAPEFQEPFARSYSQQGEDMVLRCLFQFQTTGFYVDVGAHHPIDYSNTKFFYTKGWRGINIDPRPGIMAEFIKDRSRDVNLELAISDTPGKIQYYMFSDPATNTSDEQTAKRISESGYYKLVSRVQIPTRTLADVLNDYLPHSQMIDFLSVDVEGLDEKVLRSNNWNVYRPRVVLAEDTSAFTLDEALNSSLVCYLQEVGYVAIAKTVHSIVFGEKSLLRNSFGVLVA